jgi:uncharacterized membrane protein YjgN (DUF898 family)
MEPRPYQLSFHGSGFEFFKIQVVNLILCIVTLGLYYPWARARTLGYLYSQTRFESQPFVFTGTGSEMFRGFIRAFIFIIAIYVVIISSAFWGGDLVQLVLLAAYLFFLAMVPLILHGSYKYRMTKTVWSGIRFGYTGERKELMRIFFKGIFFTIITFGIYGAWFRINMRKYLLGHVRMGNAEFTYTGNGDDFFILNLKGYFLSLFTLGIYFFWWQRDLFRFFVDHLRLAHYDEKVRFRSTAGGGDFAGLLIVNFLILVFTLGLGYAWVMTRTLDFGMRHIAIEGDIDFNELAQTQPDYSDATAADLSDFFDFSFVV